MGCSTLKGRNRREGKKGSHVELEEGEDNTPFTNKLYHEIVDEKLYHGGEEFCLFKKKQICF